MPTFNETKLRKLKKLDSWLKAIYIFPRNNKKHHPIVQNDVKEIVVIAFLLIGDTIMYLPALTVLKKNYPFAKITLVCGPIVKTVVYDQPLADNYIIANCPWISPFDKSLKNLWRFLNSVQLVNKKQYDLAIDFRGDWRNIFYMNFIRSARKISFNFSGGEYMLTDVINLKNKPVHLIDETFALLENIGCTYKSADKYPILRLTDQHRRYLADFEEKNKLEKQLVIGVHPGASLEERKWDELKYGEMLIRLAQADKTIVFLLFAGPGEKETISTIEKIINNRGVRYIIIEKPFQEYLILMSICKLIICNDSGAAHIAAAYNIPEVVIFGKGDPDEVKPFNLNTSNIISHELECKPCHLINCKFGTNLCMKMVTVDEVYVAACDIIKKL